MIYFVKRLFKVFQGYFYDPCPECGLDYAPWNFSTSLDWDIHFCVHCNQRITDKSKVNDRHRKAIRKLDNNANK